MSGSLSLQEQQESLYSNVPLPPNSIRLLQLLPDRDEQAPIRCRLKVLMLDSESSRPYEALSYSWGSADNPKVISVNDRWQLAVGQNLHAALMHLRDRDAERNLWIDAICINQSLHPAALDERSQQVQSMAKIYALATRVLVWLGDSADESDQALDEIQKAAESSKKPAVCNQAAILALLGRSWFRRFWVLQEVAAARQILIKCGAIDVDGYAFCLGLNALDHLPLPESIYPVALLIRGSIFPSRRLTPTINQQEGRFSLNIRPLGELIDMYYTREATDLRDKAYALLSMCSDDSSTLRLSANDQIPWEQVFQQLIRSIVPDQVSVNTCADDHAAVLKCRGYFLGKITSLNRDSTWQDRQHVEITWKDFRRSKYFLQVSVSPLEPGDLIFLMEGAANPTVIKLKTAKHRQHCFWVVKMIAVPIPKLEFEALIQQEAGLRLDCTLVWRLDASHHGLTDEQLTNEEKIKRLHNAGLAFQDARNLNKALWYQGKTLNVLEQLSKGILDSGFAFDGCNGESQPTSAMKELESMIGVVDGENGDDRESAITSAVKELKSMIELVVEENGADAFVYLAAFKGYCELLNLASTMYDFQVESKSELDVVLWLAMKGGHEAVARLMLAQAERQSLYMGHLDIRDIRCPDDTLLLAVASQTWIVVKLLLDCRRFKRSVAYVATAWAIANQDELTFSLLLESGQIDVNERLGEPYIIDIDTPWDYYNGEDSHEDTLLHFAARRGYQGIVRLILSHDKVDPGVETVKGNTAMHTAASAGRAEVVKALLDDGRINPNAQNHFGHTALYIAAGSAKRKHTAVVKVLADSDMVDINITDNRGLSPLLYALKNETKAVRLLLATGKVDTRSDSSWDLVVTLALVIGDTSLFKRLLEAGTLDLRPVNRDALMPTLLHLATAEGNAGIVELVLDYGGQRDIHTRTMWPWNSDSHEDEEGQYLLTPLEVAEKQGHREVAELLSKVHAIEPPPFQGELEHDDCVDEDEDEDDGTNENVSMEADDSESEPSVGGYHWEDLLG
ncbi:hypothetical protein QBC40DRAFT_319957 [Triangularia verruculosa]|uniref:Heterokaryon incompatibility domain-containing protein n=1 Tax=Triangularia verruculosa TaxID=2587418 RepID=A0AAN6X5N5_9PEZI|nr:hypothetical protein QBC40DRAFT_319957 [Triangularia verruculosa]